MKHEDIEIGKQYSINKHRPFNAEVIEGEQVIVTEEATHVLTNVQSHFRIKSLRYHAPGMTPMPWVVSAADLDEANPDWVDPYAPEPEPEPELPQEDLDNSTPL